MSELGPQPGSPAGSLFSRGRSLVGESPDLPVEALGFLGSPHRWRRRAPPAGAQPGELVIPPGAPRTAIRWMRYGGERCEEGELSGDELPAAAPGPGQVTWYDVEGFGDPDLLERVRAELGIHPLALADAVNVPQSPKAELYGDRLLVVMHMARLGAAGAIELEQVALVLGPGWVASFQESPGGDVFDPVRARLRAATRMRQQGADYLVYALVDAVVDGYFPVVEALGGVIDGLEEELLERPARATLARIHAIRRALLHLHRTQWRQRDAIATLVRDEDLPISPAVRPYLRDAHDHAFQVLDALEGYREMSIGLMDVYLSSTSHRLNEVMKTLTIMATIFIPLTFLVGVYGMNFDVMPELRWRWGYAAVWALMLAVAGGLVAWFQRRGWLGDGS
jgi:magnesium transporter